MEQGRHVTKAKRYTVEPAKETHPDPVWPDGQFSDLLESAFNGRTLSDAEDEVVQAIRKKKVPVKKKAKKKEEKEEPATE
jgi:hypothetical protein